jgi:hypothetical protein
MAKEKKPSIYSDRGTIGSSEELDEYGVWVKSEPQDLSSEEVETPEFSGGEDMDFTIPEIEDLPDLGSLDEKSSDDFSIAELPTDDFAIPDIESGGETENIPSISDEIGDDVELGDLPVEGGFDTLDIPDLEEPSDSGVLESPVELTGLDESGLEDDFDLSKIVEQDQENLSLDTGLPGTESGDDLAVISTETSTETSMDDLIENFDSGAEELAGESMGLDSAAVDEAYAASTASIQTGLRAETGLSKDSGLTAPSSSADLSTQLLMKIAEELSSIRAELSSLKKEFSVIRAGAPAAETEEGGFFDKEDDEKISLTGDELNNILNTADFTEETGTDVTMGLTDDDAGASDLPTSPDMEAVTEVVTESASPDLPEDVIVPEEAVSGFSLEETEEEKIEEKPITHDLTVEDTNYLAKEASIDAVGTIGVEEAVIDEPDLSLEEISPETQDNPVEEPLPEDLSVNLNTEEPVLEDTSSETPGDVGITSEELGDADITTEGLDDLGITSEEPGATDITSEEPVDKDITADEPGNADIASEELGNLDIAADELGDLDINTDELGNLNITADEPGSADIASEELGDLDINTDELGDLDINTDELGDLDINTDELGNLGITAEAIATEEPGTEEPGAESLSAEEPVTKEPDTGELSILELGADDFDLSEPVLEELSTGPVEEEPVSEDFGILAADEQPEEDFGILVVDEPSGEITQTAEELHEEPAAQEAVSADTKEISAIPVHLKQELKTVLSYMDQLLEALPDEKIEEFARSEYYDTYKKLFKDLGIA